MRPILLLVKNFEDYNFENMKNKTNGAVMQTGDLMLRNNQCSSVQTEVRAKGIFVDKSCYLDIDSMLKTPISKKEALQYGQKLKMMLPTKKQMRLIEQNAEIINNSLIKIGRGDCLLLGQILQDFWTRYEKAKSLSNERRCVLFLVSI